MTNEQDLVFKARFEDDASEDIQSLDKDVEGLDESMGGLSMSAVGAGLAMFGVGVGVQQVISGAAEAQKQIVGTKAMISLLPEAAQTSLADLAPFYAEIGKKVGEANLEVAETAVAITTASGGIAPSLAELNGVYDIMAATGADAATVASAVGEALRGNQEPLQQILGDKYNFHSLEEVLGTLAGTAEKAKTPLDDVTTALKNQQDELGTTKGQQDAVIESLGLVGIAATTFRDLWRDKMGNVADDAEETSVSVRESLSEFLASDEVRDFLGLTGKDLQPVDGTTTDPTQQGRLDREREAIANNPNLNLYIQGDVDSEQRAESLAKKIEEKLRNLYRGGIDSFVGGFPGFR